MSLQQLEEPPPYSKDSHRLKLPSVPRDDISSRSRLSVAQPQISPSFSVETTGSPKVRTIRDILTDSNQLPNVPSTSPGALASPTETGSIISSDGFPARRSTAVSEEDLMVAEALTGLRSYGSPPPRASPTLHHDATPQSVGQGQEGQQPEPLLSLLQSRHPWLGGPINQSLSAYASTKSYSPRFVQYGVDLIERNVGSPMANTVETVGKRTGVEGRLRNYLGSRRPSDLEPVDPESFRSEFGNKRRRIINEQMDVDQDSTHERRRSPTQRSSVDSLPAYDDQKSPKYEEVTTPQDERSRPPSSRSWSTQLIISTSGLGAALNEGSLRSLRYCLGILRSANSHVRNLMLALKQLLEEYNGSKSLEDGQQSSNDQSRMDVDSSELDASSTIAERIQKLNEEIWNTLKAVVNAVSRYTGGALPDNASRIVKSQLLSVPQRWRRAVATATPSNDAQPTSETVSSAHRMLAFAGEGLEMMAHVSDVVESTIISAERWLDSMGRKREADEMAVDSKDGQNPGSMEPVEQKN